MTHCRPRLEEDAEALAGLVTSQEGDAQRVAGDLYRELT
jgi:hypothetical protein